MAKIRVFLSSALRWGNRPRHFALGLCLLLALVTAVPVSAAQGLSVNFRNVDISLVIESVARLTERNFIVDPRVKGRVTVLAAKPVNDEELYEILLTILHVYGFAAIPGENLTKIVPAAIARSYAPSFAEEQRHALVTEVLVVNNNSAEQLVNVLRPMLSQNAHLVALANGNSLVVTDVKVNVDRIKEIIQRIDTVEEKSYEVIQLNHAPAQSVVSVVQSIYKNNNNSISLNMQVDERTNRLILTASEDVRLAVRALIADLDTPVSTEGGVHVIYLKFADAENLVPVLEGLLQSKGFQGLVSSQAEEVAAPAPERAPANPDQGNLTSVSKGDPGLLLGETTITADKQLNALILSGTQSIISNLLTVVRQLDIPRAQVAIEVVIAEINEDSLRELGLDWVANRNAVGIADLSGGLAQAAITRSTTKSDGAAIFSLAAGKGLVTGAYEGNATNGWAALIRAIDSDSGSNVLSKPFVVTLDNEEANFVAGDNVPFITGSYTNTGGGSTPTNPFNTIQRQEVGINLRVKPQINGADGIKLDIKQEVSSVKPNSINAADIVTTVRSIETSVQVSDGGIIVLGGLKSETETEITNRVPLLGRIPFIGALFRYQKSELRQTNLMLFIRPYILRNDAEIAGLSYNKYNALRSYQRGFNQKGSLLINATKPLLPDLRALPLRIDFGTEAELLSFDFRPADAIVEETNKTPATPAQGGDLVSAKDQ